MAYALEQQERKQDAEASAYVWDWTFGIPFRVFGWTSGAGRAGGVLEVVVRRLLRTDGSFENRPDTHRHHTAGEALEQPVVAGLRGRQLEAAAREAAALAFARTIGVLGEPHVPHASDVPLLVEVSASVLDDVVGDGMTRHLRLPSPYEEMVQDLATADGIEVPQVPG
jgi:hypothetical protein